MLQFEDGLGVEQVVLALAAPLVLATHLELAVRPLVGPVQVGQRMPGRHVVGDVVEIDSAHRAGQAGEIVVQQRLADADRLEELGTGVGGERGDAHLGHHLQHTLAGGLDIIGLGLITADSGDHPAVDHVLDGLEGHVRVDRGRTEADEAGHVVHLAGVTGLDDQAHLGPGALTHQMVVHGRHRQQRRDRRHLLVGFAVGQHDDAGTLADGRRHLRADVVQRFLETLTAAVDRVEAPDHRRAHAVLVAADLVVGVDADQLRQLGVAQDRLLQHDLAARVGGRVEQVALRADGALQAGDHLFADRIQRRVGHLGEHLLEVVVKHARTGREHRDRRVGAHRTQRLGTGACHRRHQQVELFVGIAEHLLAQHHAVVRHAHVVALRQFVEIEQARVQPLLVGLLRGQLVLDLLVGDDAALRGVDEEHPARLQPHLLDHGGGVQVQDAGFGRHDHQAVAGDPDARRAQPVAVEHGADHGAVGEAHRGGSVPRLHQRGVVAVERPLRRVHRLVVFPGLRDHHQHRVRQAAPAEVQQFEHLVEAGGVRRPGRAHGHHLVEVLARSEHVGLDQRFPRPHPVLVAGDGVDLTVVGDPPERVRQRPRGEGVGGEPRVHDAQRAGEPLILQIQVERLELRSGQHALEDEGLPRQAGEVHGLAARAVLAGPLGAELVLGTLAHHIGAALQLHPARAGQEDLTERRHRVARQRAQRGVVGRHVAPAQHLQALGLGDLADGLTGGRRVLGRLRQERDAGGVAAGLGQLEVADGPTELVGNLQQDARTVTGVRLGALGAAVFQVQQRGDGLLDDVAAPSAVHIGHHRHATRVMLERGVVQPLSVGRHSHLPFSMHTPVTARY